MTLAVAEKAKTYTVKDKGGRVVGKAQLRQVPVDAVKIDHSYQRDLKSDWVQLHLPFNARQAGAIVLSDRMGGPYCIDGQQRTGLARASGEHFINAFVIEGLTQADEAELFVRYQRDRTNLTAWALFRAERVSGNPETAAMERIVNNAGFRISNKAGGSPTTITAIDAIRYVHRYGGDDLLSRTLGLIKDLWIGEDKALSGQVVKGLALFLHSAGQQPAYQRARLIKVMEKHGPNKVLRLAQTVAVSRNATTAGPANVAEALLLEYNKLVPKGEQPLPTLTIGAKRRPSPKGTRV